MALQVSQAPVTLLTYKAWDNRSPSYHPYLVTPPRVYTEALTSVMDFFYEPGNDYLVAYSFLDIIDWPGWAALRFTWDAGSGKFLGRADAIAGNMAYAGGLGLGSYKKIYGMNTSDYQIRELDWDSLGYGGGWSIDPSAWSPTVDFGRAMVNREDSLLAGIDAATGRQLLVYSFSGTPILQGQLHLPDSLGYLTYEDRYSCWIITQSGLIAKARYNRTPPRWEMLSAVQDPTSDATAYFCAFDTKRKRLAVLRQRPDAADGACQSQLEFYWPVYQASAITDPVPLTPLRAGQDVKFAAHLIGAAGEGVASRTLNVSLASPANGEIRTPSAPVDLNGVATILYRASQAGADTLQLSVEDTGT